MANDCALSRLLLGEGPPTWSARVAVVAALGNLLAREEIEWTPLS